MSRTEMLRWVEEIDAALVSARRQLAEIRKELAAEDRRVRALALGPQPCTEARPLQPLTVPPSPLPPEAMR